MTVRPHVHIARIIGGKVVDSRISALLQDPAAAPEAVHALDHDLRDELEVVVVDQEFVSFENAPVLSDGQDHEPALRGVHGHGPGHLGPWSEIRPKTLSSIGREGLEPRDLDVTFGASGARFRGRAHGTSGGHKKSKHYDEPHDIRTFVGKILKGGNSAFRDSHVS